MLLESGKFNLMPALCPALTRVRAPQQTVTADVGVGLPRRIIGHCDNTAAWGFSILSMELVRRMKTAISQHRPALLLGLMAALTALSGLAPVGSSAQEPARMIATGSQIPLTQDAPPEYTVKSGDTLWDISKLFLRDPWYWP